MFSMEDGRALDPSYVTRLFQRLRRGPGSGLPVMSFHGLRHCAGSSEHRHRECKYGGDPKDDAHRGTCPNAADLPVDLGDAPAVAYQKPSARMTTAAARSHGRHGCGRAAAVEQCRRVSSRCDNQPPAMASRTVRKALAMRSIPPCVSSPSLESSRKY